MISTQDHITAVEVIDDGIIYFLPIMQTDITIRYGVKALIIDTKYYSRTMQGEYVNRTIYSNNLKDYEQNIFLC